LEAYDWPGNVRELQNVVERAVIRAQNGNLEFGLRPATAASSVLRHRAAPPVAKGSLREIKQQEKAVILDALAKTRGKIYGTDGAANLLGLKPTTLSSKVHRMGLKALVK
jgi:transcriptional regulator with GAF, ATPase, and Fis domain